MPDESIGETAVSYKAMAYLLGVSVPQVYALAKQGLLPKSGHDKFKLEGVRNYVMKPRNTLSGSGGRQERARLTRIRADLEEAKLQRLMGEVILTDEAISVFGAIVSIVRTRILALPSRCAPRIIGQASTVVDAAEIIREEVYAILDYLVQAKQAVIGSLKPRRRPG